MAAESNTQTVSVLVKMLSGDLIPIEIPSDITVKQFYKIVWRAIPERCALQSLDLLRDGGDDALPSTPMPLLPEQDEVFFAFIQTSHFILRLELVADAFHNDRLLQVFEVVIHESHPDSQESKTNPPSISPFSLPTDQDGRIVNPSYRYNTYRHLFYAATEQIDDEFVHTFYTDDEIDVFRRGRFGDEWEVEIPAEKQPLYDLTDLLADLPVSTRTLNLLQQHLRSEWDLFDQMSKGHPIQEIQLDEDDLQAVFQEDLADEGDDSALDDWA
jgi:hypothetical protein